MAEWLNSGVEWYTQDRNPLARSQLTGFLCLGTGPEANLRNKAIYLCRSYWLPLLFISATPTPLPGYQQRDSQPHLMSLSSAPTSLSRLGDHLPIVISIESASFYTFTNFKKADWEHFAVKRRHVSGLRHSHLCAQAVNTHPAKLSHFPLNTTFLQVVSRITPRHSPMRSSRS